MTVKEKEIMVMLAENTLLYTAQIVMNGLPMAIEIDFAQTITIIRPFPEVTRTENQRKTRISHPTAKICQ